MTKGKSKGSAFERELCKQLSLWWTNGERDDVYIRSVNSGGYATVRASKGLSSFMQSGDITFNDPIGIPLIKFFSIEAKTGYKEADMNTFLWRSSKAKTHKLEDFFIQSHRDSLKSNTYSWCVIHRQIRKAAIIYMPFKIHKKLIRIKGMPATSYFNLRIKRGLGEWNIVSMNLIDFLEWIDKETILLLLEKSVPRDT